MGTTLSKPYSHSWSEFRKGMDSRGAFYLCSFQFDNWSDSDRIANEIVGLNSRSGTSSLRNAPMQHPLSTNLYAQQVSIEGLGNAVLNSNGYPIYDGGFLAHVEFRASFPYGSYDDPYNQQAIDPATTIVWCTQELDFEVERITNPRHQLQWLSDGKRPPSRSTGRSASR